MEEAEHLANEITVMDDGKVVANGTADELKDQLGGNVLEVRVTHSSDLEKATALIAGFASASPRLDIDLKQISVPIQGGAKVLIHAGRALDDAGIELEDIGIRRPSLDDVFLSLTGHTAVSENGPLPASQGGTRD